MTEVLETEEASSLDVQVNAAAVDTRGKHRILAELKRVEQESRFLEASSLFGPTCIKNNAQANISLSESENGLSNSPSDPILIQEELEEVEKTENVSTLCEELLLNIESTPDPLLPITNGPANALWERWFEPPQDADGCKCWIL